MRRSALPLVILAVLVVAAVLAWIATERLLGAALGRSADPGPVTTETRTVEPFARIEANGHFALEVRQGDRSEVTLEGSAGDLKDFTTRVTDGRLVLGRGNPAVIRGFHATGAKLRVVVTTPSLEAVALSGATQFVVTSLQVPSLRIAASGASQVRVEGLKTAELKVAGSGAFQGQFAGEAADLSIALSGAGDVDAGKLVTRSARVSVSGAGRVFVHADDEIDIDLSGAGTVEYAGDPKVTKRVSGFGNVKRREGERPGRVRTRFQLA